MSYPDQLPHGKLDEVLPDVFFVTGQTRPVFGGHALQFSRNMVVVRDGQALTLINTMRLDDDGLAHLDRLGRVLHIVKLGSFHGRDDAFYVKRYGATVWSFAGMPHERGVSTDRELIPGPGGPFADAFVFDFETTVIAEGLLMLERHGGVLMSCDSLQIFSDPDVYWDEPTAAKMRPHGSFRGVDVGPGWWNKGNPQKADFVRLERLPFRHLLSAHGPPLLEDAHEAVSEIAPRLFGRAT